MSNEYTINDQTYFSLCRYTERFKRNYNSYITDDRKLNYLNYIYFIPKQGTYQVLNWLDRLENSEALKLIIKNYNDFIEQLIKPNPVVNSDYNYKSIIMTTKLYSHQYCDLCSILDYEKNNITNDLLKIKVYYNKPQSGKSFVLMALSNYKLPIKIPNDKKFFDTNLIVVPHKIIFDWRDKLKFYYKNSFYVIDDKSSFNYIIEVLNQKDAYKLLKYKIILVSDGFYNKLINGFNENKVLFNRLIFDSIMSLTKIKNRSLTCYAIYYVTNNIKNILVPCDNLILNTKTTNFDGNYKENTLINDFIHKNLYNTVNEINNHNNTIISLKVIQKYLIENGNINSTYISEIIKHLPYSGITSYITERGNSEKKQLIEEKLEILNKELNDEKQHLESFFHKFHQVDSSNYYTESTIYNLKIESTKCKFTKINKLIENGRFSDIVHTFKLNVKSINGIINHLVPNKNEQQIENIKNRISQSKCLVCYEKPEIELVTNCCKQLFCLKCYMLSYKHNKKCALCRGNVELNKLLINQSTFNYNNQTENPLESYSKLVEISDQYDKNTNFKNLIKLIKMKDNNPKIIINFTDYEYQFNENKISRSLSVFKKSKEYKDIEKVLVEQELSFFDSLGKNFEQDYKLLNNPDSEINNVFINNEQLYLSNCGLSFNSIKYIINYNIATKEIRNINLKPNNDNVILQFIKNNFEYNQYNNHNYNNTGVLVFNLLGF